MIEPMPSKHHFKSRVVQVHFKGAGDCGFLVALELMGNIPI
jgi:hypothetical protein